MIDIKKAISDIRAALHEPGIDRISSNSNGERVILYVHFKPTFNFIFDDLRRLSLDLNTTEIMIHGHGDSRTMLSFILREK